MKKINAGNRLYLYRLLMNELGLGKQTAIARVGEVLEADGIWPEDLDCESTRELMEAMPEFIKMTVFKKGYIYATVMANEEYDRSLEMLAAEAEAKAEAKAAGVKAGGKNAGKPWKRKKGPKGIKPLKPRHVEKPTPVAEAPDAAAAVEASTADATVANATGESADMASELAFIAASDKTEGTGAVEAAAAEATKSGATSASKPAATQDAAEATKASAQTAELVAAPAAEKSLETANEAATISADSVVEISAAEYQRLVSLAEQAFGAAEASDSNLAAITAQVVSDPAVSGQQAGSSQAPAPSDAGNGIAESAAPLSPEAPATPGISLTITYTPEPPVGVPPRTTPSASARASALPQDFYADVRCPDEPLSTLYQLLPPHADPMATLEEDFRVARSTGTLAGSRSEVIFPLRYQRADGRGPVTATLRRTARAVAGKRWTLVSVEGGELSELGMDSLAEETGPWTAFVAARRRADLAGAADAERALTQTVALGSWDAALAQLEAAAEPEDWGAGRQALRHYLVLAFARVQAQGLLATAADGASAAFDTGLFTPDDQRVIAHLTAGATDIPWQLADFAPATETDAAVPPLRFDAAFDSALPGLPERVARNPRLATTAYDALADRSWLLVPAENAGGAQALLATPDGYERGPVLAAADVFAVARVVSSEQPGWVRRLRP